MAATQLTLAQIDWGELGEVAVGGALGLGAVAAFALGLRGTISASDAWRLEQRGRALLAGALTTGAFMLAAGIVVYGLILIAGDGPLF